MSTVKKSTKTETKTTKPKVEKVEKIENNELEVETNIEKTVFDEKLNNDDINKFDNLVNFIEIKPPFTNKDNGKITILMVDKDSGKVVTLKTPFVVTPFGPSKYEGAEKCEISLSQKSSEQEKADNYFNTVKGIYNKLFKYVKTNIKELFPKKKEYWNMSDEMIKTVILYDFVKEQEKYSARHKVSLSQNKDTGSLTIKLFNSQMEKIRVESLDDIKQHIKGGDEISCVLEFFISVINGRVALSARASEIYCRNKGASSNFVRDFSGTSNEPIVTETVKNDSLVQEEETVHEDENVPDSDDDEGSEVDVEDV
jgi:hypothetical protein